MGLDRLRIKRTVSARCIGTAAMPCRVRRTVQASRCTLSPSPPACGRRSGGHWTSWMLCAEGARESSIIRRFDAAPEQSVRAPSGAEAEVVAGRLGDSEERARRQPRRAANSHASDAQRIAIHVARRMRHAAVRAPRPEGFSRGAQRGVTAITHAPRAHIAPHAQRIAFHVAGRMRHAPMREPGPEGFSRGALARRERLGLQELRVFNTPSVRGARPLQELS